MTNTQRYGNIYFLSALKDCVGWEKSEQLTIIHYTNILYYYWVYVLLDFLFLDPVPTPPAEPLQVTPQTSRPSSPQASASPAQQPSPPPASLTPAETQSCSRPASPKEPQAANGKNTTLCLSQLNLVLTSVKSRVNSDIMTYKPIS